MGPGAANVARALQIQQIYNANCLGGGGPPPAAAGPVPVSTRINPHTGGANPNEILAGLTTGRPDLWPKMGVVEGEAALDSEKVSYDWAAMQLMEALYGPDFEPEPGDFVFEDDPNWRVLE